MKSWITLVVWMFLPRCDAFSINELMIDVLPTLGLPMTMTLALFITFDSAVASGSARDPVFSC